MKCPWKGKQKGGRKRKTGGIGRNNKGVGKVGKTTKRRVEKTQKKRERRNGRLTTLGKGCSSREGERVVIIGGVSGEEDRIGEVRGVC